MTVWRFTVAYEGTVEAPNIDTAKTWAVEEVDAQLWQVTTVDVERIRENGDTGTTG